MRQFETFVRLAPYNLRSRQAIPRARPQRTRATLHPPEACPQSRIPRSIVDIPPRSDLSMSRCREGNIVRQ